MPEQNPENKATEQIEEVNLEKDEQAERPTTPLERLLQSFRKAQPGSRAAGTGGRRDLGKDKSKSLFVLVATAVVVLLFFLAHFSSPQKPNQGQVPSRRGQPDLGQRTTPGQEQKQIGSVTPLLTADTRDQQPERNGEVTPEDINRMSHASSPAVVAKPNTTANTMVSPDSVATKVPDAKNLKGQPYALGRIDFSDPELQQRYAKAEHGPDLGAAIVPPPSLAASDSEAALKKPSLVFVSSENTTASLIRQGSGVVKPDMETTEVVSMDSLLPAGTRLVARLESPASTAVAAPVIAAIEYNYERDGEIVVPAGSKALGKMEQANSTGYVSLRFDRIEFPDGTTGKMDGTSMDLDFGPIKGLVSGKRRGARFLVQTLTGVGTAAAYLVGANDMSGSISGSTLLRERLADNVAIAGQNEMNQVAFSQNLMVTVPGNTRFYIVLQQAHNSSDKTPAARHAGSALRSTSDSQTMPSLQELRQLLQLKKEMSQLYQQEPSEKAVPEDNQQQ
jgi:hypothetical protein